MYCIKVKLLAMLTYLIVVIFAFAILRPVTSQDTKGSTYCEFYNTKACSNSKQGCQQREKCIFDNPAAINHYYVTWHYDRSINKTTIKRRGCFLDGKECYNKTKYVDRSKDRKKNVFFRCSRDMCNQKFAWIQNTTEMTYVTTQVIEANVTSHKHEEESKKVTFSISVHTIVLIVIAAIVWCIEWRYSKNINSLTYQSNSEALLAQYPGSIQFLEVIARGSFGAVWKASIANNVIAVKVTPTHQVQSWQIEQDVLKLPHMNHQYVLKFIGAEKRKGHLQTELWLVTAYHEKGSLFNYLKKNTLSWSQLCKIAKSMLRGLMHLHKEIPADKITGHKPVVAHRDFKSNNILLKADMSACIADFGLSLIFYPDKTIGNTDSRVGTRRYMAPEILQGTINFSPDSFLRIDMYACGLVLWELASQCTLHNVTPKKYRLPFTNEVGYNPSLDDMRKIVIHERQRPQILRSWCDQPELLALCDTMKKCWDHDPETRLSVSYALEKVIRFSGIEKTTSVKAESKTKIRRLVDKTI